MEQDEGKLAIVEGVAGNWHYHLRRSSTGPALCGARVMRTELPISYWARTPVNYHLPEKWCGECADRGGLANPHEVLTTISKEIVQAVLIHGLGHSTWRDNHGQAYEDLLKYSSDMEIQVERVLRTRKP